MRYLNTVGKLGVLQFSIRAVLWSELHTPRLSLTDASMCIEFNKRVFVQRIDILRYFLVIVMIFYCANTNAFHMPDWKFSEGVVRLNRIAKWIAASKRLKTTGLKSRPGSPNYGPRAKSGPPRHFIRLTKTFCQ